MLYNKDRRGHGNFVLKREFSAAHPSCPSHNVGEAYPQIQQLFFVPRPPGRVPQEPREEQRLPEVVSRAVVVLLRVGGEHAGVDADEDDVQVLLQVVWQALLGHLLLGLPAESVQAPLGLGLGLAVSRVLLGEKTGYCQKRKVEINNFPNPLPGSFFFLPRSSWPP